MSYRNDTGDWPTTSSTDLGHLEFSAEEGAGHRLTPVDTWTRRRRALLVAAFLVSAAVVGGWMKFVVTAPQIDADWRPTAGGKLGLIRSNDPMLNRHENAVLLDVSRADGSGAVPFDSQAYRRSARWMLDDEERVRQLRIQSDLAGLLAEGRPLTLHFLGGGRIDVQPTPPRFAMLSPLFWLLCVFAAALALVGSSIVIAHPVSRNRLYALATWCQCGNFLMMAAESTLDFGIPEPLTAVGMPLHMVFDLTTAAAILVSACLHPRRLPGTALIAGVAACLALALPGLYLARWLPHVWWWAQIGVTVFGLGVIGLLTWSYRIEPHPFALVLRRFGVVTVSSWALLTFALATAEPSRNLPHNVAEMSSLVWYVFLGSLLLLVPFLARAHHALREFSLLAAICTAATSLDLLFVSVFDVSPFAALSLALFVSLVVYAGARQWILDQLLGSSKSTSERMFEQLYRIAREVEAQPERTPTLLARLIGELFEPLEVRLVVHHFEGTRVSGDGSSMLVPMPRLGGVLTPGSSGAVLMRFAQRGRRLFNHEDARLSDRIVEQLRRAVDFSRAVEHGRSEERLRIAQDLHDDIGARLLTLMYKASSTEMEEYARHTLQDLKTLTRGLATSNHRLSHASVEWKLDLTHRLNAAHVELIWTFVFDDDIELTAMLWSALTRVLRELVSNVIAHSQARRIEISFRLMSDRVDLQVRDDGIGRHPDTWSHGLGLGGVRKRVKQLGGSVEWGEATPRGIACRVVIEGLSTRL